jgi:predicted dehydrogenase
MVAQTLRWNPVLLRARELWPSLGVVRHVRIVQRLEPTALLWQRDPAATVGGSVLLTGVHLFDTVRFLTGREFVEVDARWDRFRNPVVEDFFLARARLDDGAWVSMEVSKFGAFRGCRVEAVGEAGQLAGDYYAGGLQVNRGRDTVCEDVDAATPTLPAILADWRDSVVNAITPPVTITDGVKIMEVVEACYSSHEIGRPVTVGG